MLKRRSTRQRSIPVSGEVMKIDVTLNVIK